MMNFTPDEIQQARLVLRKAYQNARRATFEAVAEETAIGQVLLQATHDKTAQLLVRCQRCGLTFIPVPCCIDPENAHCPGCGELHELAAPAGAEVAPHEVVSISAEELAKAGF